jgi:hypothetical protein
LRAIARILDSPYVVGAAMAVTLALGYFFIFVWAPHPWSWQGIDSYHEIARVMARGESFPTTDVPWGYATYAAFFYRVFGDRIWVPLVVQATANALVPWLLYRLVAPLAGSRVAAMSAIIVGIFSFNTIYASTQSSDALCTVLFLVGLLCLARGLRAESLGAFALAGACFGLVPQFRPNLVLLPGVLIAVLAVLPPRGLRRLGQLALFAVIVAAMQMPWVIRNYRLTGMFLPTSTHGGVQLWYGTLQVGPYLESRAHNPRFHFASAAFTYTSIWRRPLDIRTSYRNCSNGPPLTTQLIYWTDRDSVHRRLAPLSGEEREPVQYTLPPQPNGTVLYYYFEQKSQAGTFSSPSGGAANPHVAFISDDHLGDLDRHGDMLDLFDVVRVLRHLAWREPLTAADKLDLDHNGVVDEADVRAMIEATAGELMARAPRRPLRIEASDDAVTLRFPDDSWLTVPLDFNGTQTGIELSLDGEIAPSVASRSRTFTSIAFPPTPGACAPAGDVVFNGPFYLAETHMMQRYFALAADNINRDPGAFVLASLYRAIRLFVVRGTEDVATAQQFRASRLIYGVGTALSIACLAAFIAGAVIAYRRHRKLLLFLVPILYVPLSICFVLTNMRYTVTVQPLMFAFIAVAVVAALGLDDQQDH